MPKLKNTKKNVFEPPQDLSPQGLYKKFPHKKKLENVIFPRSGFGGGVPDLPRKITHPRQAHTTPFVRDGPAAGRDEQPASLVFQERTLWRTLALLEQSPRDFGNLKKAFKNAPMKHGIPRGILRQLDSFVRFGHTLACHRTRVGGATPSHPCCPSAHAAIFPWRRRLALTLDLDPP